MTKEQKLLAKAQELAASEETWASFRTALFDSVDGLVIQTFPTREEREKFIQTSEYQQIQELLLASMPEADPTEEVPPEEAIPDWMKKAEIAHDTPWTHYQNSFNAVVRAGETGEGLDALTTRCKRIGSAYMDAMFAVYVRARHDLHEALVDPKIEPQKRMRLATAYYRSEGALASLLATLENVVLVLETSSPSQTPDTGT